MKFLSSFFTKLYQYATVFIVVASPLFYVPGIGFRPEVTYFTTMMVVVAIALLSYVISAFTKKSWHTVSRIEFVAYFVYIVAVLLSVAFARNPRSAFFGDGLSSFSAIALLSLPIVVYLVRTLPDTLRLKLKYVLAVLLCVSAFLFMSGLVISGMAVTVAQQVFSGFSSAISFGVYIGIFILGCFFFLRKAKVGPVYKAFIILTALVFLSWVIGISGNDGVRPGFQSSLSVASGVMVNSGPFGIGANNYARAWQLYRPDAVITSTFFNYDFNQGYSTIMTLFTTVGLVGVIGFLLLTLAALYVTYKSYREMPAGDDRFITGFLAVVLLYLSLVSWVVPFSFSILVVWMVVAGFGFAKAKLTEYHPSKRLAYAMVPLALIFIVNIGFIIQKAQALSSFNRAQNMISTSGPTEQAGQLMQQALSKYPYDVFDQAYVEYVISYERALVASTTQDQGTLQDVYSKKAQTAVDAGLQAVSLNPDNYQNYVSLGRAYELAIPFDKQSGYSKAKEAYTTATKLYPNNPYLYVMLARLEASAGTKEGIRQNLTEALKKKQNFADALYLMSQLDASEQKMDEALQYAIEAVKNAPNDPLVYTQAGLLFYGKKDYQNAVTALNTALQKDQNNATIAFFLALALRDGGRPDLAKTLADELLRRNPTNADVQALVKSLASYQSAATSTPRTLSAPAKAKK